MPLANFMAISSANSRAHTCRFQQVGLHSEPSPEGCQPIPRSPGGGVSAWQSSQRTHSNANLLILTPKGQGQSNSRMCHHALVARLLSVARRALLSCRCGGDNCGVSLGGSQAAPSFWRLPLDFPRKAISPEVPSSELPRRLEEFFSRGSPKNVPWKFPNPTQRSTRFSGKPDTL